MLIIRVEISKYIILNTVPSVIIAQKNIYFNYFFRYSAKNMLHDLRINHSNKFQNFCQMSSTDFEYLLRTIAPYIVKMDTNMRESIPIQERLAVTLRYLASGDSFISLSYTFKFSSQTVSRCVQEVCTALVQELKDEIKVNVTCIKYFLFIILFYFKVG